jgi:Secretion system C-terminal sorting domain
LICDTLVANSYRDTFAMICGRDTISFFDTLITTGGLYDHVFLASNGGDSVITLSVDVAPIITLIFYSPICWGDTLYVYGQPVTIDGPFTFYLDTFECGAMVEVGLSEISPLTAVVQIGNTLHAYNSEDELQWYDCTTGDPVPGATENEFTPTVPGSYRLKVITSEGCEAFSSCYEVLTVSTLLPEPFFPWSIQPNPGHDYLQVLIDAPVTPGLMMEVFDMTGIRQIRKDFSNDSRQETVSLQHLSPGLFVIRLTDQAGKSASKTFIKI